MKPTTTTCAACNGTGLAPLTPALSQTMGCFNWRRLGERDAADVSAALSILLPCARMRLAKLVRMGLLSRTKRGHAYRYSRAK